MRFFWLPLLLILFFIAAFLPPAFGKIQIPTNLSHADRLETVRILGLGTSSKVLSDPYPLGGYEGFEAGIAIENLPVEDLGRLGNTLATPQKDIAYPKFSIGKGLYQNLDFFVHFVPYSQKTELSHYGGIARWGAYQAKFLPLNLSLNVHFNNTNISNLVTTRSFGLDVIGGINVDNVALYVGGGPVQCRGRFITGVTSSNQLETETVNGFHTVIGANVHVSRAFVTLELDRYTTTVYSAKLGLRY